MVDRDNVASKHIGYAMQHTQKNVPEGVLCLRDYTANLYSCHSKQVCIFYNKHVCKVSSESVKLSRDK